MSRSTTFIVLGAIFFAAFLAGVKREETPESLAKEKELNRAITRDAEAIRRLRAGLKNPASFKMDQAVRMDDGVICISFRASNSFNAIVPAEAVITPSLIITSDQDVFQKFWNSRCAGKAGEDIGHIRHFL